MPVVHVLLARSLFNATRFVNINLQPYPCTVSVFLRLSLLCGVLSRCLPRLLAERCDRYFKAATLPHIPLSVGLTSSWDTKVIMRITQCKTFGYQPTSASRQFAVIVAVKLPF